jgi:ParB-like chromosome segregation protein Spo0J
VVDGHHRLKAAKQLGLKEVPVEEVKLPYAGYKTTSDLIFTQY